MVFFHVWNAKAPDKPTYIIYGGPWRPATIGSRVLGRVATAHLRAGRPVWRRWCSAQVRFAIRSNERWQLAPLQGSPYACLRSPPPAPPHPTRIPPGSGHAWDGSANFNFVRELNSRYAGLCSQRGCCSASHARLPRDSQETHKRLTRDSQETHKRESAVERLPRAEARAAVAAAWGSK